MNEQKTQEKVAHPTQQRMKLSMNKTTPTLASSAWAYGKSERRQRYINRLASKHMEHMKYLLKKYGDPYYSHVKEEELRIVPR